MNIWLDIYGWIYMDIWINEWLIYKECVLLFNQWPYNDDAYKLLLVLGIMVTRVCAINLIFRIVYKQI